ncbi:hypothetical protein JKP88DRAFT_228645 [Tribonema minus]|uniref:Uncharacterized protein n=1 Tax=Tribonema minus TaxID=303371 RepID=A0A835YHR9_9STRA|nr:hypothetical protein JKP88DRAFT_228645 [Tribonema minus]
MLLLCTPRLDESSPLLWGWLHGKYQRLFAFVTATGYCFSEQNVKGPGVYIGWTQAAGPAVAMAEASSWLYATDRPPVVEPRPSPAQAREMVEALVFFESTQSSNALAMEKYVKWLLRHMPRERRMWQTEAGDGSLRAAAAAAAARPGRVSKVFVSTLVEQPWHECVPGQPRKDSFQYHGVHRVNVP